MEKFRSNKLGIEIEINRVGEIDFEIKESKNCVKVSYKNKRVVTILPDSKIEFLDINHIVCYKGRVAAFGSVHVEAWGMSRVFAKDKSYVVAYQGAEVRAGGRAKVHAYDSSRVVAGGRAKVFLDGKSIGYRNGSRVEIHKLDSRAAIFDIIN